MNKQALCLVWSFFPNKISVWSFFLIFNKLNLSGPSSFSSSPSDPSSFIQALRLVFFPLQALRLVLLSFQALRLALLPLQALRLVVFPLQALRLVKPIYTLNNNSAI